MLCTTFCGLGFLVVSLLINGSLRLMWALWWLVDPTMSTWALWYIYGPWMHKISLALFVSLTIELWFQRRSVVFTMSMWNCLGVLERLWQHVVFWTWWRHFVVALSCSLSYRMPFYRAWYILRCSCHWCLYIARLFRWSFCLWCSEVIGVFQNLAFSSWFLDVSSQFMQSWSAHNSALPFDGSHGHYQIRQMHVAREQLCRSSTIIFLKLSTPTLQYVLSPDLSCVGIIPIDLVPKQSTGVTSEMTCVWPCVEFFHHAVHAYIELASIHTSVDWQRIQTYNPYAIIYSSKTSAKQNLTSPPRRIYFEAQNFVSGT
jgi:hypothetical protein